jgi:hypothetical protein
MIMVEKYSTGKDLIHLYNCMHALFIVDGCLRYLNSSLQSFDFTAFCRQYAHIRTDTPVTGNRWLLDAEPSDGTVWRSQNAAWMMHNITKHLTWLATGKP